MNLKVTEGQSRSEYKTPICILLQHNVIFPVIAVSGKKAGWRRKHGSELHGERIMSSSGRQDIFNLELGREKQID